MIYPNHFSRSEFECKGSDCCGNSAPMDSAFLKALGNFRERLKLPIVITSGFRCNKHNKAIGGTPRSYHAIGRACDVKVKGLDVEVIAKLAREFFGGVIVYDSWVHVDTREGVYYADKR